MLKVTLSDLVIVAFAFVLGALIIKGLGAELRPLPLFIGAVIGNRIGRALAS